MSNSAQKRFDDDFVQSLPEAPISAIDAALGKFSELFVESFNQSTGFQAKFLSDYIDAYGLVRALIIKHNLTNDIMLPQITVDHDPKQIMGQIAEVMRGVRARINQRTVEIAFENSNNRFNVLIGNTFHYQFTENDIARIQKLINELREKITSASGLDEEHRQRVLTKLEKLQSELHKKVGDLDHFWGLLGEAGTAMGKLGNDAKPIVDRIREIAQIVWRTQAEAEKLPSGPNIPLISSQD